LQTLNDFKANINRPATGRWQKALFAPLFNREHLLSKAIPQFVGSGVNLRVQL
jgi:16S rRNA G966 N2-methylase RsmD